MWINIFKDMLLLFSVENNYDSYISERVIFAGVFDHRLLSREEEKEIGRRIAKGRKIKRRNTRAINELAIHNYRLASKVANDYFFSVGGESSGIKYGDILRESIDGVHKAAEKYDYRKKNKFSTYACWWVRQRIQIFIKKFAFDNNQVIRLPVGQLAKKRKIDIVIRNYFSEYGSEPSLEEIAKILNFENKLNNGKGYTTKGLNRILEGFNNSRTISLDEIVRGDDECSYLGERSIVFEDKNVINPSEELRMREAKLFLDDLKKCLDNRERAILNFRYAENMTLEETSKKYNLTRERIRQIQVEAIKKLRSEIKRSNAVREMEGLFPIDYKSLMQ